ncbi:hypothetical protein AB8O64_04960 [Streptomyces sp. QH1-20]|uniref:hypothetical protein n=1 Tax=Streptomyces sp. QH1-20 TaxID=3240934 RepID=UPI003510DC1F
MSIAKGVALLVAAAGIVLATGTGAFADADVDANVAGLANVDADVNILPYRYGPHGYGSLLNADIDLNLLNGYDRGYRQSR